jgi:thiol-disulfide isomerase/thioredoxin
VKFTLGVVAAAVLAFAMLASAGSGSGGSGAGQSARSVRGSETPDAVAGKLAAIPASVFHSVGVGSAISFPLQVDAPPLTRNGKPAILYMGAEYCPYCATERWSLITALSRFGRFTGLHFTHSALDDSFPNTQTFTFHGSQYQSSYVVFESVELKTNQPANGFYGNLESPTPEQRRLMLTYDAPPYFRPSSSGGIPFIDLGGRYLVSGASYDPSVLQGKSAVAIANEIADPSTAVSQGAIGTANALTAAICGLTGKAPANVCSDPAIAGIAPKFK